MLNLLLLVHQDPVACACISCRILQLSVLSTTFIINSPLIKSIGISSTKMGEHLQKFTLYTHHLIRLFMNSLIHFVFCPTTDPYRILNPGRNVVQKGITGNPQCLQNSELWIRFFEEEKFALAGNFA